MWDVGFNIHCHSERSEESVQLLYTFSAFRIKAFCPKRASDNSVGHRPTAQLHHYPKHWMGARNVGSIFLRNPHERIRAGAANLLNLCRNAMFCILDTLLRSNSLEGFPWPCRRGIAFTLKEIAKLKIIANIIKNSRRALVCNGFWI